MEVKIPERFRLQADAAADEFRIRREEGIEIGEERRVHHAVGREAGLVQRVSFDAGVSGKVRIDEQRVEDVVAEFPIVLFPLSTRYSSEITSRRK